MKESSGTAFRQYDRAVVVLLACVALFRVVYLAIVPFDLVHDEAYYWDWSRQLDWCYYSKPPGIAWLIALTTNTLGTTAFSVRLPAAILSTTAVFLSYCLGRSMYDSRTGFIAAALVCLTPGNAAAGVMMTIDAPLLTCWSISLYCFWRMLARDKHRRFWTIATSLAVGAGLLFKQTMLAFPLLAGTFVMVSGVDRVELRRRSFWCGGMLAMAGMVPIVIWNSQHEWITFAHTQGHFAAESVPWLRRLTRAGEFFGSQFALLSPVTYVALAATGFLVVRHWPRLGRSERYLAWFWLGPIIGIGLLSFVQRVEANWPAPFYASGIVLLAAVTTRELAVRLPAPTLRRSLLVGGVSIAATYLLPFVIIGANLRGSPVDIAARMWGWRQLAEAVNHRLERIPAAKQAAIIVTDGRKVASELAFYLPDHPQVHVWNADGRVTSQYDIWGWPAGRHEKTLIVTRYQQAIPRGLVAMFRTIDDLGVVSIEIGNGRRHAYRLWMADP